MLYNIFFAISAALSYWLWRYKYLPIEVAQNAADIKANGAADNLQRGYHGRRVWARVWPGLACCLVPSLSFSLSNLTSCLLSFAATATLLLGVFVRDFTTKLNLARIANGETHLSEWFASGASKSWPDAGAYKAARRRTYLTPAEMQAAANAGMKATILRTYYLCLLAAGLLTGAAAWIAAR